MSHFESQTWGSQGDVIPHQRIVLRGDDNTALLSLTIAGEGLLIEGSGDTSRGPALTLKLNANNSVTVILREDE